MTLSRMHTKSYGGHVTEIDYSVVKSWLFSTAYHNMIDIIRKEKRMTSLEVSHEQIMIYESQYSDLNEILHEAVDRLPEQQKTAVMLRDYEGYSYKEIGEITGLSEAQVKINIYRGRLALKSYIGKIETVDLAMQPDRTNYEIWLIDYLDGTLDEARIKLLLSFLNENPDIKEEFADILTYTIKPATDSFKHKNSLKKSVSDLSDKQFEYLCISASENDLSEQQKEELEMMVAENQDKRKTFEIINRLKLVAPVIKYNKKSSLRKLTLTQKIVRLSVIGLSAAAGIAIMIISFQDAG